MEFERLEGSKVTDLLTQLLKWKQLLDQTSVLYPRAQMPGNDILITFSLSDTVLVWTQSWVTLKGFRDPHIFNNHCFNGLASEEIKAFTWTKSSPHCNCVQGHPALSKLKDFYPLQSVMKAWKGFLLRYSVFDGFSLFTMNLGLKNCSLSLLDWNPWNHNIWNNNLGVIWSPLAWTLTVHTRWKIKWETIIAWRLPSPWFWSLTSMGGRMVPQVLGCESPL